MQRRRGDHLLPEHHGGAEEQRVLERVQRARAKRRVEQRRAHARPAAPPRRPGSSAPGGRAFGSPTRSGAVRAPLAEAAPEPSPRVQRQAAPQADPRARQDEQRRRDEQQQHVLDHVHPEELRAQQLDRRGQRDREHREGGVEAGAAPALGCALAPRRDGAPVADPVQDRQVDHEDERRVERPVPEPGVAAAVASTRAGTASRR